MNRRSFIKRGALWVPPLFAIGRARGQALTLADPAMVGRTIVASGSDPASFTDNFTRANSNPMSNPGSGGTWTSGPGSFNDCEIDTNRLDGTSYPSGARVLTPTFSANQKATVTITTSTAMNLIGPCVRINSTTDCDCYIAWLDDSTHIIIYKATDTGSFSVSALGATFTVSTVSAGTTIGLSASGTSTTTLELFLNGASQGTRTDSSSPYTTGQPGVFLSNERRLSLFEAVDL